MLSNIDKKIPIVLIVDDTPTNVKVVALALQELKYKIVIATNGETAIKMVERTRPDLILMDVMMPGMDGYEACKIIKQDEENKNIPVIFLTALTEKTNIIKGFDVGGVDFITKPFNNDELVSRVQTHLELKLTRDKLLNTTSYLEELNSVKDKMFSVIGHDLRSPLSGVKMTLDLLAHTDKFNDDEELRMTIDMLVKTTDEVYNLLDNLLGWAKSQSGNVNLIPEKVNLKDLVNSVHILNKGNLKYKNIQFESDIDEKLNVFIDLNSMNIVFRNLLSNAIKFTPDDGRIGVIARQDGDDVIIEVQDNGVGIPEENISKLFDNAQHVTTYGTNRESGSGLGLLLCHDFVTRNGGNISVESEVGKGTNFILKLPVANDKINKELEKSVN